jgi:hypothetical protein
LTAAANLVFKQLSPYQIQRLIQSEVETVDRTLWSLMP